MDDISVIVPTRNEESKISEFLQSVKDAGFKGEIIVVDADSKDRTVDTARRFGCKVVKEKRPQSPAHARKLGLEIASGKILVILDADMKVDKNFFRGIRKVKDWDALKVRVKTTEDTFLERLYNLRSFEHPFSLFPLVFKKYVLESEPLNPCLGVGEDEEHFSRIKRKFHVKKCEAKIIIHTVHNLKELSRQIRWYGRTSFVKFNKTHDPKAFTLLVYTLIPAFFLPSLPFRIASCIIWIYEFYQIVKKKEFLGLLFPVLDTLRGCFFLIGMVESLFTKRIGR